MNVRDAIACLVTSATVLAVAGTPASATPDATGTGTGTGNAISFRQRLQSIDGLGFADGVPARHPPARRPRASPRRAPGRSSTCCSTARPGPAPRSCASASARRPTASTTT